MHRGRFQAQDNYIDESERWAQDSPLLYKDGVVLIDLLENKLTPAQRHERKFAFSKCRQYVKRINLSGGYTVVDKALFKSFPVGKRNSRVDLEIHEGSAFVNK
jgi:hypothetical protein